MTLNRNNSRPPRTVHHLVPRERGGSDKSVNLKNLSEETHGAIHLLFRICCPHEILAQILLENRGKFQEVWRKNMLALIAMPLNEIYLSAAFRSEEAMNTAALNPCQSYKKLQEPNIPNVYVDTQAKWEARNILFSKIPPHGMIAQMLIIYHTVLQETWKEQLIQLVLLEPAEIYAVESISQMIAQMLIIYHTVLQKAWKKELIELVLLKLAEIYAVESFSQLYAGDCGSIDFLRRGLLQQTKKSPTTVLV